MLYRNYYKQLNNRVCEKSSGKFSLKSFTKKQIRCNMESIENYYISNN